MYHKTIADFFTDPLHVISESRDEESTYKLIETIKSWVMEQIALQSDVTALRDTLIIAAEATTFHQDFQLMFSEAIAWTTPGQCDRKTFYSVLAASNRSKFALFQYLQGRPPVSQPFFISAFLPKSGGTFLSTLLRDTYRYRSDIFYAYGSADTNYLIPARVEVLKSAGGEFNHLHLGANTWNEHVVRQLKVPFWLHLRDPRDAFFSSLSMMLRETERPTEDSQRYLDALKDQYGPAILSSDINIRARLYLDMLHFYCSWCKYWLAFDYGLKTITYHSELADLPAFKANLEQCLGINPSKASDQISPPSLSYKVHRFNSGVNGRWRNSLDMDVIDSIQGIYSKYFNESEAW